MQIPFGDLKRQYSAHTESIDAAVHRVMQRGWFVLGNELDAFEQEWANYCGAPYCVGCGSGTEAIHLALWAEGIVDGAPVITVANTCVPTVAGIGMAGDEIRLCDADVRTALMDPAALDEELSRRPARAVVPVHLYGQPVDLDAIRDVAERHGCGVIEDAAQAHGALYKGKRIGSHGTTTCWSFYPSKNLGAFGDAGAVTTHSAEVADRLRKLRNYGQERRYYHSMQGCNSRLDEIQAAILREKLPGLDVANRRRRQIAQRYRTEITNPNVQFIDSSPGAESCEHLFALRCHRQNDESSSRSSYPSLPTEAIITNPQSAIRNVRPVDQTPATIRTGREQLLTTLAEQGVECLIHYPVPIHLQEAYRNLGYDRGRFPSAESLCSEVLSLPMFPELTESEVDHVIRSVNEAFSH